MYYQNYEDYMHNILGYPINDPNIYETYDYRNDSAYEDTYSSRNQTMSGMSEEEVKSCYPEIYHLVYPMVCKVCDTNTQPLTRELIEKMTDEVYMAIEDTTTTVNIRVETPKMEENRSESNSSLNSVTTLGPISTVKSNNSIRPSERNIHTIRRESRMSRLEDTRTPKVREDRNLKDVNAKVVESSKSSSENVRNASADSKSSVMENREVSTSRESRISNFNLRDLIKILLLERLFGNRPGRPRPPRPPKPPFPGGPNRPPFPGGPGMPPPRPPFQDGRPGGANGRPPMIQQRDYTDYLEF